MLTITIRGKAGEGKTTLGAAIQKYLRGKGFKKVTLIDEDEINPKRDPERQKASLEALSEKPVNIKTSNVRLGPPRRRRK